MNLKTNTDQWQEKAPRLAQMEKINPFEVPDGYFESLPNRIQERIAKQPKQARILSIWMPYAAAACLVAVLSILMYTHLQPKETFSVANIPDEEITSYLQSHVDDSETELVFMALDKTSEGLSNKQSVSTNELETYLNQML